ncbi:hypothetical protein pEaSNUABM29_00214 [Erwinia phage pEa_SNUABM_29]|nr:hypothetical protein pEaSNUABM29_00214 [Erwinia phage pEa_SNUABM_29]
MSEEVKYQAFDGDVDNEDSLLRQTQQLRVKIVTDMTNEAGFHTDLKAIDRVERLINGIDKQVMTKRKIKAAEKGAEATSDLANSLNGFLMQRGGLHIGRHDDTPEDLNGGYQPVIPEIVAARPTKDGELAPVGEKVDVDSIMAAAFKSRPQDDDED